jgi:predicted hydrocarbon binding protein
MSSDEKKATNLSIRAAVDCFTEILGKNGARIVFRNAGFERIFDNPPPYDLNPNISVESQTKLYIEVGELFGLRGALSIWRRVGYTAVKYGHEYGHAFDGYKGLSPDEKFNKCSEFLSLVIGKGKTEMNGTGRVNFDCFDCTVCSPYYDSDLNRPVCLLYTGALQYIADWAYGKNAAQVVETKCKAKGDDTCYYELTMKG